jgi:hypothetical protein
MLQRQGVLPFIFAINFSSFFGPFSEPELHIYKGSVAVDGSFGPLLGPVISRSFTPASA